MVRKVLFVLLVAVSIVGKVGAAELVRKLRPSELAAVRVWEQGYDRVLGPLDDSTFGWQITFKNETTLELASVTVEMLADYRGKTVHSAPVTIRTFSCRSIPHIGSLLPMDKTFDGISVPLSLPGLNRLYLGDPRVKVVDAETFVKPNLEDPGHLYTRLWRCRGNEAITLFKSRPDLLKVVDKKQGMTVSLIVAATCNAATIKYVLANGGSIKDKTGGGATLTHLAATNQWPDSLPYVAGLLKNVNSPSPGGGRVPAEKAIVRGLPNNLEWLLNHGANANHVNKADESLAAICIREGQEIALNMLKKHGLNSKVFTRRGESLYHLAIFNDEFLPVVASLGLPINIKNPRTGDTPLLYAFKMNRQGAADWFVVHGGDPTIKNKAGDDVYSLARKFTVGRSDALIRARIKKLQQGR